MDILGDDFLVFGPAILINNFKHGSWISFLGKWLPPVDFFRKSIKKY